MLSLHDEVVHLPTLEEKESAKAWVTAQVCPEWSNGHLMVDGTKFSLFQRPGLHGDMWFDKNKNYSLDVTDAYILSIYLDLFRFI
jgi:hypothetical protein